MKNCSSVNQQPNIKMDRSYQSLTMPQNSPLNLAQNSTGQSSQLNYTPVKVSNNGRHCQNCANDCARLWAENTSLREQLRSASGRLQAELNYKFSFSQACEQRVDAYRQQLEQCEQKCKIQLASQQSQCEGIHQSMNNKIVQLIREKLELEATNRLYVDALKEKVDSVLALGNKVHSQQQQIDQLTLEKNFLFGKLTEIFAGGCNDTSSESNSNQVNLNEQPALVAEQPTATVNQKVVLNGSAGSSLVSAQGSHLDEVERFFGNGYEVQQETRRIFRQNKSVDLKPLKCRCGFIADSEATLKTHFHYPNGEVKGQFKCKFCANSYTYPASLQAHLRRMHKIGAPILSARRANPVFVETEMTNGFQQDHRPKNIATTFETEQDEDSDDERLVIDESPRENDPVEGIQESSEHSARICPCCSEEYPDDESYAKHLRRKLMKFEVDSNTEETPIVLQIRECEETD